jgi:DNA-directed RNA polymerase subunit RPC12/RpoP
MNKVIIRCQCGHRILRRDVLGMRFYLSLFGPSYVSVHYRCGRCKRISKALVEEQRWAGFNIDRAAEDPLQTQIEDRKRFASMGPITPEELIDFHFALEKSGPIEAE